MIALLTPTRGRQKQYIRMANSARATASNAVIFDGTNGDDQYATKIYPADCPTVFMWNDLAKEALAHDKIKLFMLASDDIIFATPGWDEALLDHYNKLENKIHAYHLQDSRDPEGTPHPIVTREYMDHSGYFVTPIFLHWYVDTWTVAIAKHNRCFLHLKDFSLIHDKPSDEGRADTTHMRIRTNGWQKRDKEVNDTCQHILEFEKSRLAKAMQ